MGNKQQQVLQQLQQDVDDGFTAHHAKRVLKYFSGSGSYMTPEEITNFVDAYQEYYRRSNRKVPDDINNTLLELKTSTDIISWPQLTRQQSLDREAKEHPDIAVTTEKRRREAQKAYEATRAEVDKANEMARKALEQADKKVASVNQERIDAEEDRKQAAKEREVSCKQRQAAEKALDTVATANKEAEMARKQAEAANKKAEQATKASEELKTEVKTILTREVKRLSKAHEDLSVIQGRLAAVDPSFELPEDIVEAGEDAWGVDLMDMLLVRQQSAEKARNTHASTNPPPTPTAGNNKFQYKASNNQTYELDMTKMTQRNVQYNTVKMIRQHNNVYQWKNENNAWVPYDSGVQAKITKWVNQASQTSRPSTPAVRAWSDEMTALTTVEKKKKHLLPEYWQAQSKTCEVFDVKRDSAEYKEVVTPFVKGLEDETRGRKVQIHKVERIQNKHLWLVYAAEKTRLTIKLNGDPNEKTMYHGTKSVDPEIIFNSQRGFDHSMGATGGMFGPGIYFADNPHYSDKYYKHTKPGSSHRQMIIAKVLAGDHKDYKTTYTKLRRPPEKAPFQKGTTHQFYDSVGCLLRVSMGDSSKGNMVVVYDNCQCYPAYLFTYT